MINLPSPILSEFSKYNFSPKELTMISSSFNEITLRKNESFSVNGSVCDKLGILVEGLLFANFEINGGKLNVSRFYNTPENIFVTSFDSFKNEKKSIENVIAIEESKLVYITKSQLDKLRISIPRLNLLISHFAESSYISALDRIHDLQVLNSQQRVEKFFKTKKTLYNRVEKKLIASYLGVNRNDLTKYVNQLINN